MFLVNNFKAFMCSCFFSGLIVDRLSVLCVMRVGSVIDFDLLGLARGQKLPFK